MGLTIRTLKERATMPLHTLKERTYLDITGKATTDLSKAFSLLGAEGDEITQEQAHAAGLIKEVDESVAPEPKMLYYNAAGEQVKADADDVQNQYLDNDPNRPDSPENKAHAEAQAARTAAVAEADAGKPVNYDALNKADLVELAEKRSVTVVGKQNRQDYIDALKAADAG